MESEKSVAIEEACRFCWMCRHLCPVALVTGNEANTPRGRALVMSMDRRNFPYGKSSAEKMFQCCLCYACTDDCATGYDPTVFTREARSRALSEGLAEPKVKKLAASLLKGNNPLIHEKADTGYTALTDKLPEKADVLIYRSGYTKSVVPFLSLLARSHIEYTTAKDEPVSGTLACDVAGYVEEAADLARKWASWMNKSGAKTVVCFNPGDVYFAREQMAKWDISIVPEIMTATAFTARMAKSGKIVFQNHTGKITYHDPSRMARNLEETEEPRMLLTNAGWQLNELFLHGHLARSAGSIVLQNLYPEIEEKVGQAFWEDAVRSGIKEIVTASPETLACLVKTAPHGMKAVDIFSML